MEDRIDYEKHLDPWWSMWVQPRETMRQILDTDPEHLVLSLAAALGIIGYLNYARLMHVGDHISWPGIVGLAVLLGSLFGVMQVYLSAWLLRVTGRWMDGTGTPKGIRAALTWGRIPVVWAAVLWVPLIAVMGQDTFTTPPSGGYDDMRYQTVQLVVGLLNGMIGIWSLVVSLKALGEAQGFSAWRALGNFLLAGMILVAAGMIVALIVAGFALMLHLA